MISQASRAFLFLAALFTFALPVVSQQQLPQAVSPADSANTVVLPAKLIAGRPATLAVIGANGHLAPGVGVDISGGGHLVTDAAGRATFTVPNAPGVLLAKLSGVSSAAAVILAALPTGKVMLTGTPAIISSRDRFTMLGSGFQGDADANHVEVGGKTALVLAASPVALVALASPGIPPGQQQLSVRSDTSVASTSTTLVDLSLETGGQAITPHQKTKLIVRVLGSDQPLIVEARNLTPGVVRFRGDNPQWIQTSGGADNTASIDIEGVQPGDFGFRVKLISNPVGSPDLQAAQQYLQAAEQVAPEEEKPRVEKCLSRLRKPINLPKIRADIEKMLVRQSSDFTILLIAARTSLATP